VAEKPAILPTHPQEPRRPSLLEAVRGSTGLGDLQPAHRLDVGTSGPVAFARGEALAAAGRAFATGGISKEYLALVRGVPRRSGRIRSGRGEDTRYRLVEVVGGYGLLSVRPATGARHQIRRHLRRIGHPILGDQRYGDPRANRFVAETCGLARPFLHLALLELPAELAGRPERPGETIRIESALPPELCLVLDRLRALRERPVAMAWPRF
jgi:23S rRNA-/tRNA-specific pseudouridylate synthase